MMRLTLVCLAALSLSSVIEAAPKKGKNPPAAGTVFLVSDQKPTWPTCDVEFRDPADKHWPNFFFGKPASTGSLTFDPKNPKLTMTLKCDTQAQKNGDQGQRVLGELLTEGKSTTVTLTLTEMQGLKTEKRETLDRKGRKAMKDHTFAPVTGILDVGGKKASIKGEATFRWGYPKNADKPDSVYLEVRFAVPASGLGLKNVAGSLDCRAGVTAYTKLPEAKKKKK